MGTLEQSTAFRVIMTTRYVFILRTWSDGSRIEQLMIERLLLDIKVLCATGFRESHDTFADQLKVKDTDML